LDSIDRIKTLLEESRTRQGEAREQIYRAIGQMFDLIFELDQTAVTVAQSFEQDAAEGVPESSQPASAEPSDYDVPPSQPKHFASDEGICTVASLS
jgi:hypothetical protein